jgi:hypothetical protein
MGISTSSSECERGVAVIPRRVRSRQTQTTMKSLGWCFERRGGRLPVAWCGDILVLYIFLPFRMIPDYTSTVASGGFGTHVLVLVYICLVLSHTLHILSCFPVYCYNAL